MKANFLPSVETLFFKTDVVNSGLTLAFLQSLVKLKSFQILDHPMSLRWPKSLDWLAALKSLSELREIKISIRGECSPPPAGLECGSSVTHT